MHLNVFRDGLEATKVDFQSTGASPRRTVGNQQVVLGDCLTELRAMAADSVDVVITSPPYNIGVAYRSYRDRKPRQFYLVWLSQIGNEIARVLKDDGSFFLNVGSTNADPWIALEVAGAFRQAFVLQNHIMWVKSVSIGIDTVGHFKPITSRRYLNQNHEAIFHFTKSGAVEIDRLAIGVPFKDKSNIARWGHTRDRRCGGNVWFIPYETVKSKAQKFNHPAGFPVGLPLRCLKLHGRNERVVLDPFLGAGTTLVAAAQLGHHGIGIESDPHYAQTAVSRLQAEMPDAQSSPDHPGSRVVARGDRKRPKNHDRRCDEQVP
jgi:site-specific DNA-methyltransferase (adenine-specific)